MKNLILIVFLIFTLFACKKDDNPTEPKDEWVVADSLGVQIFDGGKYWPFKSPNNFLSIWFTLSMEEASKVIFIKIDSLTDYDYIRKFYSNYPDSIIQKGIFDPLNNSSYPLNKYTHIFSFLNIRTTLDGSYSQSKCLVNHKSKVLRVINYGKVGNILLLGGYFRFYYSRLNTVIYKDYKIEMVDSVQYLKGASK